MSDSIFPTQGFSCVGNKDVRGYFTPPTPGLTKRELFAAMAMQGLLSSFETKTGIRVKAKTALWAADLLILELAKSKELGE